MLNLQDVVVVKDESGKLLSVVPYSRTYYSSGPGDETEVVDVTSGGKVVGQKTRPKGATKCDVDGLFAAMIEDFQTQDEKVNPILRALQECEYSADLGVRNSTRARTKAEAEGPEKAIEQAVKKLLVAIPGISPMAARAMIQGARAEANL